MIKKGDSIENEGIMYSTLPIRESSGEVIKNGKFQIGYRKIGCISFLVFTVQIMCNFSAHDLW